MSTVRLLFATLLLPAAACSGPAPNQAVAPGAHLIEGGVIECEGENDGGPHWTDLDAAAGWPDAGRALGAGSLGHGLVVADLTGDGQVDIFVPGLPAADLLYVAQTDGTWVDEASSRLPFATSSLSASSADWDGDGDLDMLLGGGGGGGGNWLFVGEGGSFTEAEAPWDDRIVSGATWGDIDGDTDLDAFVYTLGGTPTCEDGVIVSHAESGWLWRNDGTSFVDVSSQIAEGSGKGMTFVAAFLDVDLDGDKDLYTVNDAGWGPQFPPNHLLINDGSGNLVDAPPGSGAELAVAGMGLGVGDLNDDSVPDLLISDWGQMELLVSDGPGAWFDAAEARGVRRLGDERVTAWSGVFGDVDNDGDLDIAVGFGPVPTIPNDTCGIVPEDNWPDQPDALYLQEEDGSFSDASDAWGFSSVRNTHGLVLADLDDDGSLDVVERAVNAPARILQSHCGPNAWVRVALVDYAPNLAAIGARVEVTTGDRRQTRWIEAGGTGVGGVGPAEAHFGLGDATTIDTLSVFWPDGRVSTFDQVTPRQRISVVRD